VYTCVVFVFRSLKTINIIPTTLTIVNRINQLSHLTVDVNPFHKTQVLSEVVTIYDFLFKHFHHFSIVLNTSTIMFPLFSNQHSQIEVFIRNLVIKFLQVMGWLQARVAHF
jgi:hypothetical protein